MAFTHRQRMNWGLGAVLIFIAATLDITQTILFLITLGLNVIPFAGQVLATFFVSLSLAINIMGALLLVVIFSLRQVTTQEQVWLYGALVFEIIPISSFVPLLTPAVIRVVFLVMENDRIYNIKHGTSTTQVVAARNGRTLRSAPRDTASDSEGTDWD